jgi:hypothetical protein
VPLHYANDPPNERCNISLIDRDELRVRGATKRTIERSTTRVDPIKHSDAAVAAESFIWTPGFLVRLSS